MPGMGHPLIELEDVRAAHQRIADGIVRTPLLPLKADLGRRVILKPESLQRTGSFKIRGASNKIRAHADDARRRGVIAYSSGNHAQGVALAAATIGARATVVTLDQALAHKVEATRGYGAEVVFGGTTSLAIRERAEQLAAEHDLLLIPPFDDPELIAGQGTCGLEIAEDLPEVGTVLVPIGGGGLISGVATVIRALCPHATIIGVEPVGACAAMRSRQAGRVVTLETVDTIADGLKPLAISERTFAHMQARIDDIVVVTDVEILEATRHLLEREKLVVEPSGAATLAALMHGRVPTAREPIVAILSGGNADLTALGSATSPA